MEQTIQQFRTHLKPSTIHAYVRNLNYLFKILPEKDPFNDVKLIEYAIKDKHYTTKRNYYNSIVIYLQAYKQDQELIKKYAALRDTLNEQYVNENKTGKISDAQADKFIEYDRFIKMIKDMKTYVNWLMKSTKTYTNEDHKKYTAYVIFEMLSRFPTRLDMVNMKYLNKKSYNLLSEEEKKHSNYLVKDGTKLFFSYNDYKTSGKYNEVITDIPPDLKKILNGYIKFRKIKFQDILFVNLKGSPIGKNRMIELLGEASEEFAGVRLGTTIIRKIVASHHFLDHKKAQDELSKKMMNSTAMQNLVYVKEK